MPRPARGGAPAETGGGRPAARGARRGGAGGVIVAVAWAWALTARPAAGLQLTGIAPANLPTAGNVIATLTGSMFGKGESSPRVRIGGTACQQTRGVGWVSDTSIRAVVPPSGVVIDAPIVLTLQTMVIQTLAAGFSFDSPVMTALAPQTSSPVATESITVFGHNFGSFGFSGVRLRVGDTAAVHTTWVSSSSVYAKIPDGAHHAAGRSAPVVVSVSASAGPGLKRTMFSAFTYAVPQVVQLEESCGSAGRDCSLPANAPTAGSTVTVLGSGFGASDYSVGVVVGHSKVAHCTWISDTTLVARVSPGVQGEWGVLATIDGQRGGSITQAFFYDTPVASHIDVKNGPTAGGTRISIFGMNFGNSDYSSTASVGKKRCEDVRWESDSILVCTTPSSFGTGLAVAMTLYGRSTSVLESFSYDSPSVSRLNMGNGPSFGKKGLRLEGRNFGTIRGAKVSVHSLFGGGQCEDTIWTSDSELGCRLPSGVGQHTAVVVELGSQHGTLTESFSYDTPEVARAGTKLDPWNYYGSQANLPAGKESTLSVIGRNFGNEDYSPQAAIGGTPCLTSVWQSDSSLLCSVHGGLMDDHAVVVSLGIAVGTFARAVSFDRPSIRSVTPQNAVARGGAPLTIVGTNFGAQQFSQMVTLSGCGNCPTPELTVQVAWTSDSSMVGKVPAGRGVGHDLTVQLPAEASLSVAVGMLSSVFTYDDPAITMIEPMNGPTTGEFQLTVSGSSFYAPVAEPLVKVGETSCHSVLWMSDSSITCTARDGVGSGHVAINLQINGCTQNDGLCQATASPPFKYDGPHPWGIIGDVNSPSSGGSTLTVWGKFFGLVDYGDDLQVKIGATLCSASSWMSDSSVQCSGVSPGVGTRDVAIHLAGNSNALSSAFTYNSPVITSISQFNSPAVGGVKLLARGESFGHLTGFEPPIIAIGGRECNSSQLISEQVMECESPPGYRVPSPGLEITYRSPGAPLNQEKRFSGYFNYENPVASQVLERLVPGIDGGSSFTVTGRNFGGIDSSPSVFVGMAGDNSGQEPMQCSSTNWLSDSSVRCITPKTGEGVHDVHYLAGGAFQESSFESPVAALQKALSPDGIVQLGGKFAWTLNSSVEFVDVPPNVSVATLQLDCDAGNESVVAKELGAVSFGFSKGFCQADKGKGGFVVVAYLLPFSAPLSADNSTIALFDVLVLKFLGLSGVLGEVGISLPVSALETLAETRRQKAVQTATVNGYAVRAAYLDHCQGVWKAICNSNLAASQNKVTGQVPADILNAECSGAMKKPPRCFSRNDVCGGGLRVSSVAFRSDPCSSQESDDTIIVFIIVGVILLALALLVCAWFVGTRQSKRNGKDMGDYSYDDSYDDSDSRVDGSEFLFGQAPSPIVMQNDPGSIVFDNYSRRLGAPPISPTDVESSLMMDLPGPHTSLWSRSSNPFSQTSGFSAGALGQMGGLSVMGPGGMFPGSLGFGVGSAPPFTQPAAMGPMTGMGGMRGIEGRESPRGGSAEPMAEGNPFAFRPAW